MSSWQMYWRGWYRWPCVSKQYDKHFKLWHNVLVVGPFHYAWWSEMGKLSLWERFRRWWAWRKSPLRYDGGYPKEERKEDTRIRTSILNNTCPDCNGVGFYEGPHGGMSVNIFCANDDCCQGFNITPFAGDIIYAERIPKRVPFQETKDEQASTQ